MSTMASRISPHLALNPSSSPDPLNESTSDHQSYIISSPTKARSSRRPSLQTDIHPAQVKAISSYSSKHLGQSPNSPTKTITEQTLSPWKIRVTVEAEPEEGEVAGKMQTVTHTTTIPLRSGSSPIQTQQMIYLDMNETTSRTTRSRSRSNSTKSRQRSSTPKAGHRRRQSVTDLDIVVLGDDAEADEWNPSARKKSPRKPRRGSLKPDNKLQGISSVLDESEDGQNQMTVDGQEGSCEVNSESPELRQIDLNMVSVRRPRSNSTRQKIVTSFDADHPIQSKENIATNAEQKLSGLRKVSLNSTRSYPTPSPTPSEDDRGHEAEARAENVDGFDTIIESEGFTMIDLDSIPSVQQLRSSPAVSKEGDAEATQDSPAMMEQQMENMKSQLPTPLRAFPSYLHLAEGESDISSALPSSPPLPTSQLKQRQPSQLDVLQIPSSGKQGRHRHVTPQTYSSPKLPSPPRPVPPKEKSTPDSSKALRAGIMLQNAVQPPRFAGAAVPRTGLGDDVTPEQNKTAHPNELFTGFDSGIQRELRAGLRFGEELAKQPLSRPVPVLPEMSAVSHPPQPQVMRVEQRLDQTPPALGFRRKSKLAAATQSSRTRRSSMLSHMTNVSEDSAHQSRSDDNVQSTIVHASCGTQRESEAHREPGRRMERIGSGETVVAQADEQVETHDVTMQDDDGGDGADIWLAEAIESSSSPRGELEQSQRLTKASKSLGSWCNMEAIGACCSEAEPGGRGQTQQVEAVENETMVTNTEGDTSMSGLFWKAVHDEEGDVRFGAGQISDTRRQLRESGGAVFGDRSGSGTFDLTKMIGTPKRIRDSLDKEEQARRENDQADTSLESSSDQELAEEEPSSEIEESFVQNQPQKIPVNFNDSSFSQPKTPSLDTRRSSLTSIQQPPTPRSALKGSRQSVADSAERDSVELTENETRRVVWARRSSHMGEDWIESSRSMISDDSSVEMLPEQPENLAFPIVEQAEEDDQPTPTKLEGRQQHSSQNSGWLGWFRHGDSTNAIKYDTSQKSQAPPPSIDGASDPQVKTAQQGETWEPTSTSAVSPRLKIFQTSSTSHSSKTPRTKLPSYLLPPSYPSDPKCSITKPLPTTGPFTNTHFRTLHIIYAKSSRPRFHAPQIEECRPEIRKLVTEKWRIYVDEERAGMGGFEFRIGEKEGRVLERFCREIEWGYLSRLYESNEISVDDLLSDTSCIWGGLAHGMGDVAWGWDCEMLANWLARIVVGEVVRVEEYKK